MKKSVTILLFVLISMVSFSQDLFVSIGGAKKVKLTSASQGGERDIIVVNNNSTILSFTVIGNPQDAYSVNKGLGTNVIETFTINNSGIGTFTIISDYDTYNLNVSGFQYYKLRVKYLNPIFNISTSTANNTVYFSSDTLIVPAEIGSNNTSMDSSLNYMSPFNKPTRGIYEYVVDQSPNIPTVNTTTVSTPNNIFQSYGSNGVWYLHLRAYNYYDHDDAKYGLTVTQWITYSTSVIYTPSTVNIAEIENVTDFKLYPNPAKDVITVEYSSKNNIDHVSLYTITGQEVSTTAVESMGNNTLTFNVESYPAGIYFVRIGTTSYKFIKQ